MAQKTLKTALWRKGPGLSKKQSNVLLKSFILDQTAVIAAEMAGVNRNTVNNHYRRWREAIYRASRRAPRLSGEVEIDQAEFSGPGKKKSSALIRRLAGLPTKEVIDRGKEIESKFRKPPIIVMGFRQRDGNVYVQQVERQDERTLLPIIHLVVEPGSTIYSDKWAAFNKLEKSDYVHRSINHSLEYSDRKGTHINGIENFWSVSKGRIQKFHGVPRHTFQLHLKESEFRYNHRDDLAKALKAVLK